jgi:hypothetical protein
MEINDQQTTPSGFDEEALIEKLNALQPGKHQQKAWLFEKAYPGIESALSRQVPQKSIVAQLEEFGLELSMGGFRSMLEATRKQRKERGDSVRCPGCGNAIEH